MTEPQKSSTDQKFSPLPKIRELEKVPRIGGAIFKHIGKAFRGAGHVRWRGIPLEIDFTITISAERRSAQMVLRTCHNGEVVQQTVNLRGSLYNSRAKIIRWFFFCPAAKKGCVRKNTEFLYLMNEGGFGCRKCARAMFWRELHSDGRRAARKMASDPEKIKAILKSPLAKPLHKGYALKAIEMLRRRKKKLQAFMAKYDPSRQPQPDAHRDKAIPPQTPSAEADTPPRPHTLDSPEDFPYSQT